jgi:glycosyltransferase involved in cell wall biosynthesis
MMLYKLLFMMNREDFDPRVVSLTDIGPVGEKIYALGVPVQGVGMRRGILDPAKLWSLARQFKAERNHVVQTWMYHADLLGGLAAHWGGGIPVIWGIRHSNLDPEVNKRTTIWTAKICARLSHRLPTRIVCCSETSRRVHIALGYAEDKMVVIPNGFDTNVFMPNPEARFSVREELGIPQEALLIGLVGRFDSQKDHHNFIKAAARLIIDYPHVFFLLCGDGISWDNALLAGWIKEAGLQQHFYLLGRREDIPQLTAALDIASLSSCFEAFPNVIGEAMSCGVPCVVTDVGDSALIVGETGLVVPPRDPEALAQAWKKLIRIGDDERRKLGEAARRRILDNFSLPEIAACYEALYREVAWLYFGKC